MLDVRRREFIAALGGTAAAWPLAARAQQPAMPVIGFLHPASRDTFAPLVAAFRQGMNEVGYVEGRNLAIEYRWGEGDYARLPALAAELARRQVAAIVTLGSTPATLAAKAATSTIPIIFAVGIDPVEFGLVASFNRPGGNLTGVVNLAVALASKRLELLREFAPQATVIAVLVNPISPSATSEIKTLISAAPSLGRTVLFLNAGSEQEIDAAFATAAQKQAGALLVLPDAYFVSQRAQLAALASRHAIPAMYHRRDFAAAGGLVSYGDNLAEGYRQAGIYAGRVLKGEKPGELPVVQPTKFEMVINLKAARALGLDLPARLLALADEVIE
jgi:putative ABC transport system substrate-binding protein